MEKGNCEGIIPRNKILQIEYNMHYTIYTPLIKPIEDYDSPRSLKPTCFSFFWEFSFLIWTKDNKENIFTIAFEESFYSTHFFIMFFFILFCITKIYIWMESSTGLNPILKIALNVFCMHKTFFSYILSLSNLIHWKL